MSKLTGFAACKNCFEHGMVSGYLCRKPSDVCPNIPSNLADHEIVDYLKGKMEEDMVNHPPHYNNHPSGIECIAITEHMGFCCGNAVKYIWRADLKHDAIEDLKKAEFYIKREIAKREKEQKNG